jgi:hypothetical protein
MSSAECVPKEERDCRDPKDPEEVVVFLRPVVLGPKVAYS